MHNHDLPFQYATKAFFPGCPQIIDVRELALFDQFFANNKVEPEPPVAEVPDDTQPILVYGSFIPQFISEELDITNIPALEKELESFLDIAHDCFYKGRLLRSALVDFKLFPEQTKGSTLGIPAAFLIRTSINFNPPKTKQKTFGFGYSAFARYANMGIIETILNRPYILCLKRQEKGFDPANDDTWQSYIREDFLGAVAYGIQ